MKRGINQVKEPKSGSKAATPIKTLAQKREEAEARADARKKRGDKGQIARLNKMFGKDKGAKRERKRLLKRIKS